MHSQVEIVCSLNNFATLRITQRGNPERANLNPGRKNLTGECEQDEIIAVLAFKLTELFVVCVRSTLCKRLALGLG